MRQNFAWTMAGSLIYAACQWGVLVAIAKLGTREMVGQFALGAAICNPVILFTNLHLRTVQATDAKTLHPFSSYLGLRILSSTVALATIMAIGIFAGYSWDTACVVMTLGLAKGVESFSDIFYGLHQQFERMDMIATSMMIRGSLFLIVMSVGYYLTKAVYIGCLVSAIAWVLVLVCYDAPNGTSLLRTKGIDLSVVQLFREAVQQIIAGYGALGRLAWLAFPLGLSAMMASLSNSIPRYIIEKYLGEGELGAFAAIAYLMTAGTLVVTALGQSSTPRLAKYYACGNIKAFWKLTLKTLVLCSILGLAGVAVALAGGPAILRIIYKPEYAKYSGLLSLTMVAAAISYVVSYLGYAIMSARYFTLSLVMLALVNACSLIACSILIPQYGLMGAAESIIS